MDDNFFVTALYDLIGVSYCCDNCCNNLITFPLAMIELELYRAIYD